VLESLRLSHQKASLSETRGFLAAVPFARLLGVEVQRTHADGVTLRCTLREELLNNVGGLHGGVTATLVDIAVAMAVYHHFGRRRAITTVEMKVNYFRPVATGTVYARAHLLRVGRTLCVGRVDIVDDHQRAVGVGMATYMILENEAAGAK
jgi:uncharacterized protein (TIGR00369 family)